MLCDVIGIGQDRFDSFVCIIGNIKQLFKARKSRFYPILEILESE